MRTVLIVLAAGALLTGCGGVPRPEPVQIVKVKEEVQKPCKVDLGPEPTYHDTDGELARVPFPEAEAALLKNPMNFTAIEKMGENLLYVVKRLRAGRNLRIARDGQKDAALAKCTGS